MKNESNSLAAPNDKHNTQGVICTTRESIPVKVSRGMARSPWKYFLGSLVSATILSIIGIKVGGFSIAVENTGWRSRQTLIANRDIQANLIVDNQEKLFNDDDGSVWDLIEKNKKQGWDLEYRRHLSASDGNNMLHTKERRLKNSCSDCDNGDW